MDEMDPQEALDVRRAIEAPALAVGECVFGIVTSLLAVVPIQVQQGDIQGMKAVQNLSASLNGLGELLQAMGSEKLKRTTPEGETRAQSSIILPS